MPVYANRPTVIPCRATHPDITMKLMKKGVEVEQGEDLVYTPDQGFKLLYPNHYYTGSFKCVATYTITSANNETDDRTLRSRLQAILQYQGRKDIIP